MKHPGKTYSGTVTHFSQEPVTEAGLNIIRKLLLVSVHLSRAELQMA